MNRWASLLLIGLLVVFALSGLKAEQEPVTITVWDFSVTQSKFIDNELRMFMEKNPSIKVVRTRQVSAKYKEFVNLAYRSGNLPDIMAFSTDKTQEWMSAGYFRTLDKWFTKDFINQFPKGSFAPGINMYNGHYYSFPQVSTEYWCQFYCNGSVFKKAGLVDKKGNPTYPKTWAEVKKFAKLITQKGKGQYYGFGMMRKPEHLFSLMMYEWARVAGAPLGPQDLPMGVDYRFGRYNWTHDINDGYNKMFKFLLSMQKDGSFYPNGLSIDDETMRAAFGDCKIGMIMAGVWAMNGWDSTHPNFKDYDVLMIPPLDEKGYRSLEPVDLATASSGMTLNCKHPEEAWKLLEWYASPAFGERFVKAGMGISIHRQFNTQANARSKQYGQYMEIGGKYTMPGPNPFLRNPELANVKMKTVVPDHQQIFWGIMSGQIKEKDIPKVLKDLEDRMNKNLEEAFAEAQKKGYKVSLDDLKFPDWKLMEPYQN